MRGDPEKTGSGGSPEGERPTGEEWARTLSAAIDQVSAAEKASRRERPRASRSWTLRLFFPLLLAAVAVAIWNWRAAHPGPPFEPEAVERSLEAELYLTAESLEAIRARTGRYPADLASVGLDDESLSYVLEGPESYLLEARAGQVVLSHRSGAGLESLRRSFEAALAAERPSAASRTRGAQDERTDPTVSSPGGESSGAGPDGGEGSP